MSKAIDELRAELAALEGKIEPEPQAETEEERLFRELKENYGHLLNRTPEQERQARIDRKNQIEAVNRVSKACPDCLRVQAIENQSCELCGAINAEWLPAATRMPEHDGRGYLLNEEGHATDCRGYGSALEGYCNTNWRKQMATSATVNALRGGCIQWTSPDTQWKVQHCQRILHLLGHKAPLSYWGEMLDHTPVAGDEVPQVLTHRPEPPEEWREKLNRYFDYKHTELKDSDELSSDVRRKVRFIADSDKDDLSPLSGIGAPR